MKAKIIELIKKYRAESEDCWTPENGYDSKYSHGLSVAYDDAADDLEELLKAEEE